MHSRVRNGEMCIRFSEGYVKINEKPFMTYLKKSQSALIFFCSIPFILHKALDKSPPQPKMLSSEKGGVGPVATIGCLNRLNDCLSACLSPYLYLPVS